MTAFNDSFGQALDNGINDNDNDDGANKTHHNLRKSTVGDNDLGSTVKPNQRQISPPPVRRSKVGSVTTSSAASTNVRAKHSSGIVVVSTDAIPSPPSGSIIKATKPVQGAKRPTSLAQTEETLNPRKLAQDPAGHQTRLLYLKKLHEEMLRLNKEVMKSQESPARAALLTSQQLITLALDEEESIAKESPSLYGNVIKLRIMTYKKMQASQWISNRTDARRRAAVVVKSQSQSADVKGATELRINTGLSELEEIRLLPFLCAKQQGLEAYGYVTSPPTEEEIVKAKAGVEASQGWEQCDRCKTRFQVFPDRREDGALTSGGRCTYHWGRSTRPQHQRTDTMTGHKDAFFSCCNESVGNSAGCTTGDSHVFKISEAKRLATILQFQQTPENPDVGNDTAVSFDCEMGYTVKGLELIRLTAVTWPAGDPLLDVLVRPLGAILDLNSRFSGVRPEHMANAVPYTVGLRKSDMAGSKDKLVIVESPMVARELLFRHLSPGTPLIGHAIDNDLNAARIVHPCIVDTVLLFPHPRGLPLRRSLKALAKQYLGRDIQMGGAAGHDSHEDAKATGDVVLEKVRRTWQDLQRQGWTIHNGEYEARPDGSGLSPDR